MRTHTVNIRMAVSIQIFPNKKYKQYVMENQKLIIDKIIAYLYLRHVLDEKKNLNKAYFNLVFMSNNVHNDL